MTDKDVTVFLYRQNCRQQLEHFPLNLNQENEKKKEKHLFVNHY